METTMSDINKGHDFRAGIHISGIGWSINNYTCASCGLGVSQKITPAKGKKKGKVETSEFGPCPKPLTAAR